MFKIKSIHFENFMSSDSVDLDIDEHQITAITGENGSGKSTLLCSVGYCIGGYRKGESVKNYVKTGTDTSVVRLDGTLRDEPITYEIEIYNSPKHSQPTSKKIIYRDKVYLNSECNQFNDEFEITDLLDLMFMFQGSNDIINAKPAERANMLKKAFKFGFDDAVAALRVEQDQNKTEETGAKAVLKELESTTYEKIPLMREVAPITVESWENRIESINSDLHKIGDVDESELDTCENQIATSQKSITSLESKLTQDKASVSKLNNQLKEIEQSLDVDVEEVKKEKDKINQEIAQHEVDYTATRDSYNKLNEELSILDYKEKELESQYSISKTGVCHACGQPIEKEHIDKLKKELETTSDAIKNKKTEIANLAFDKRDTKGKELLKKLSETEDRIKKYNSDLRTKESITTRISDITSLITERETALKGSETSLSLLLEKKKNLSAISDLIKEKNNLVAEKKEIEKKLQDARDNKIKNAERKATNEKMLKEQAVRDKRIKEINTKLNDLALVSSRIKEEIDIFENQFPNFIVVQACEHLEDVINSIVQRVFPYCRVSLKLSKSGVNFYYMTESSDSEWIPVSMASGAQAKILSIAYFVALARLSGITCIFLDEIDAAMSAENAAKVYEFIGGLDYFDQVFFISHRKEAYEAVKAINDKLVTYVVENGTYTEI